MLIFLDGTALERSAPEKILLFAYGKTEYERNNQSMTYEFCEADADRLIGDFEKSGVDLPVDYHHQSLFASKSGIQAPAAGWITALSKEPAGLFASVKWTDKAKSYLESGEYRYTSPTFYKNKDTGHVAKLVNLALTNIPATSNCPELVAAENIPDNSGGKEHPMKDVLEILGLDAGLEEAAAEAAVKEKCGELLALQSETNDFIAGLREPLALEADVSLESLSGMILGLSERAKQCDAAKAELEALRTESLTAKKEALIAEALEKGMSNAQADFARNLSLEQLEGFCKTMPDKNSVPLGKTSDPAPRKEKKKSAVFEALGLDDDEDENEAKKKGC